MRGFGFLPRLFSVASTCYLSQKGERVLDAALFDFLLSRLSSKTTGIGAYCSSERLHRETCVEPLPTVATRQLVVTEAVMLG